MKKVYENTIMNGDALEHLKELPENSVDTIITDPPYGLSFMGKHWDYDVPSIELWKECLRVIKPGGYLLSFAGTRTYHRMCVNIEDTGFEIRDCIMWLYGSGFPKSLNIGKQIDKIQGNVREEDEYTGANFKNNVYGNAMGRGYTKRYGKGNSEWEGWGTALKPACEPIVVARKPLSEKNVALNVLKWGTGGINIDESRIGYVNEEDKASAVPGTLNHNNPDVNSKFVSYSTLKKLKESWKQPQGRFPANIILDEEAGKMLDEQSGIVLGGHNESQAMSIFGSEAKDRIQVKRTSDKGGASRFFYCAKASKSERNLGCEELDKKPGGSNAKGYTKDVARGLDRNRPVANHHPTVKPIALMEYLIKLVTKENAIVLDPFLGSGTTAIACVKLNRQFIGIEKEPEYIKIAEARIKPYLEQEKLFRDFMEEEA